MNKTLQLQLGFVGASLLVLLIVAFFMPAFKLTEVRFQEGEQAMVRTEKEQDRKARQSEIDAGDEPADETATEAGGGESNANSGTPDGPSDGDSSIPPAAARRMGNTDREPPIVDPTEPPPSPSPTPGAVRTPRSRPRVNPSGAVPANGTGNTAVAWPSGGNDGNGSGNTNETFY